MVELPLYDLEHFKHVHREPSKSSFGYNSLQKLHHITGFELYSSEGLIGSVGPLRSDFHRMSITIDGTLDMQIGLEDYRHQPRTVSFTYPNQVFAKNNISADAFGYYMLFSSEFLSELIPPVRMAEAFPFLEISGTPLFRLAEDEMHHIKALIYKINDELQATESERIKAIKMYLYLILLECKRSYEKQQLYVTNPSDDSATLVSRFRKLVSRHFLTKRKVADYAELLSVSPNHLNRVVKAGTAKTASDTISEMLLIEAKSLLKYTGNSVAEIAYHLNFSDPASFNRFFKACTNETPLLYRNRNK